MPLIIMNDVIIMVNCQVTCLSLYRTMTSFYKYRAGILNSSLGLKGWLYEIQF